MLVALAKRNTIDYITDHPATHNQQDHHHELPCMRRAMTALRLSWDTSLDDEQVTRTARLSRSAEAVDQRSTGLQSRARS